MRTARRATLDALAVSRTIVSEDDGTPVCWWWLLVKAAIVWDGAAAPGGPPKAEPGAGSAGRGAGGAALIYERLNSAVQHLRTCVLASGLPSR